MWMIMSATLHCASLLYSKKDFCFSNQCLDLNMAEQKLVKLPFIMFAISAIHSIVQWLLLNKGQQ